LKHGRTCFRGWGSPDEVAPAAGPEAARPRRQARHDVNGKPIFNQILEFRARATADRFGAMVLNLIRSKHPDALDGDAQ
jgi:hypothetical protein